MVSAIKNGRSCIGIEIDESYAEMAFNRINNGFGQLFERKFDLKKIISTNG
jgi:DNA modification methylase